MRRAASPRPRSSSLWITFYFALVCSCAGSTARAQVFKVPDAWPGMVPMTGTWQFHTGDNMAWADPAFDDSKWQAIKADAGWGAQGHSGYRGFAWYRRRIDVGAGPATKNGPIGIFIPPTTGAYEVYWNGKRIGGVGSLPPHAHWYPYGKEGVFSLGAATGQSGKGMPSSGELCLRFWAAPMATTDDPAEGGFISPPSLGNVALLQQQPPSIFYREEHTVLPRMIAGTLMIAAGVVALLFFLCGQRQTVYLGLAILLLPGALDGFLPNLQRTLDFAPFQLLIQLRTAGGDIGLWLVLLCLFGLAQSRRWRVATWIVATIYLLAELTDCAVAWFWQHAGPGFVRTDLVTTQIYTVMELYPAVLVGFGLGRLKLNTRTWGFIPMSVLAVLYGLWQPIVDFQDLFQTGLGNFLSEWHLQLGDYDFRIETLLHWALVLTLAVIVILQQTREGRRRAHIEQEIRSAQEVQQVLIPEKLPAIPGLAVASIYKPAAEVGGDFFQVMPALPNGPDAGTLIVVGDVSGKGLRAAMTVSLIVGTLRTLADHTPSPAAILAGLNRRLIGRTQGGFVTCLVLRIDPDGTTVLANAGHLPPYRNGRETPVPASLPLGLTPDAEYDELTLRLREQDTLALITDGVLEARNAKGELYGFERLATLMQERPTADEVADAACRFGQEDDITVVTVTVTRETTPSRLPAVSLHSVPVLS